MKLYIKIDKKNITETMEGNDEKCENRPYQAYNHEVNNQFIRNKHI